MAMNLHTEPAFLSISQMLKATPFEEAGERFIYLEASNEALDVQNEVVLSKALEDSAEYFLRYGNIDLDHVTQVGARSGIQSSYLYEIGQPVDVRIDGKQTFVKAVIFSGEGSAAEKANQFWDSITGLNPPQRWYPSVGGAVLEKSEHICPKTHAKRSMVTRIRWTNIGMSRTPTNSDAPVASTIPLGVLAKCWGPTGLNMTKAISLSLKSEIADYWAFQERVSGDLLKSSDMPSIDSIFNLATLHYGVTPDVASEYVEKFMLDIGRSLKSKKNHLQ